MLQSRHAAAEHVQLDRGRMAGRAAWLLPGVSLFILALELLKKGAAAVTPLLRGPGDLGTAGALGFGWIMACVVLSGSPVAAIALALLAAGTLSTERPTAMIGGSRLGASFVVLVIGMLDDLRNRRTEKRSAYIGVAALVTTAIVYVPAMALGLVALRAGAFAGLRLEGRELASLIGARVRAPSRLLVRHLPAAVLFLAGIGCLLAAFRLIDRALPDLQGRESPMSLAGRVAYRPWFMFVIGLGVTALTLSVSVSLSLLVPLAAAGTCGVRTWCPTSWARTSPRSSTPCSRARWWAIPMACAWWRADGHGHAPVAAPGVRVPLCLRAAGGPDARAGHEQRPGGGGVRRRPVPGPDPADGALVR